jgi:hypothetical protein
MSTWAANTYNWNTIPYAWDDQLFYPAASSLALTGKIPISTTGVKISPDNGALTLSTTAPEVVKYFLTYVGSASLTLTGQDVTAMTGHIISPAAGSLTGLSAGTIWSAASASWATYSGNWDTGTISPAAGVTYTFTIDSADNLVLTPYEPAYPIERDPKFIATVTLI